MCGVDPTFSQLAPRRDGHGGAIREHHQHRYMRVNRRRRPGASISALTRLSGPGAVSRRVHSRYERRLLDTPIGGREVVICLVVRRFLGLSPECAKVTFAEQVPPVVCPTSRYARRTPAVTAVLEGQSRWRWRPGGARTTAG